MYMFMAHIWMYVCNMHIICMHKSDVCVTIHISNMCVKSIVIYLFIFPKNILSLVINSHYKNVALFLGSPSVKDK